jgi:hypothetical protein
VTRVPTPTPARREATARRRWVAADAVRVAGVLSVLVALTFDAVAVALMLLVLGGLVLPRLLRIPGPLDLAYGTGLLVAAWSGILDVYESVAWWDLVVHFAVTGLVAAVAYLVVVRLGAAIDPVDAVTRGQRGGLVLITLGLGLALSVQWEIGEWLGHTYLDESIYVSEADTIGDLVAGGLGSVVAGLALSRRSPAASASATSERPSSSPARSPGTARSKRKP